MDYDKMTMTTKWQQRWQE